MGQGGDVDGHNHGIYVSGHSGDSVLDAEEAGKFITPQNIPRLMT